MLEPDVLKRADPRDLKRMLTFVGALELRKSFSAFCKAAWIQVAPQKLVWGWHLDALCEHLVYMTLGEIRFLMVNLPPRHTKSLIASVMWPAWHWLHNPKTQFLSASVDNLLALDFSRLARRIIESHWYQDLFQPAWYLLEDENAGRQYRNNVGGSRNATSVQGRVIGSGGDVQILDDAHDAKKVESDATRQATLTWHDNSWRSRLNNPLKAQKLYIGQRTHDSDVYGHVMAQEGKRWVQLVLSLEFDPQARCITYANKGFGPDKSREIFRDPRKEEGEMLDPKRFDAATAKIEKGIMSTRAWMAQYQQKPEGEGGLILKRGWWRPWVFPEWHPQAGAARPMPDIFELIQVYDTAFEEDEEADFTARTTWGIFNHIETEKDSLGRIREGVQRTSAMLLDCLEERLAYPDLREEVMRSYQDFQPDWVLIEKKASGHSLIQELKRKRIPVRAVGLAGSGGTRSRRQGDLIARAHESSLMLEKGCIWYTPSNMAHKVIEHCAKFPNGDHDDITSTVTLALQYMRKYYDLTLPDDEQDDDIEPFTWAKRASRRYA